jgi:hypothetical protein
MPFVLLHVGFGWSVHVALPPPDATSFAASLASLPPSFVPPEDDVPPDEEPPEDDVAPEEDVAPDDDAPPDDDVELLDVLESSDVHAGNTIATSAMALKAN